MRSKNAETSGEAEAKKQKSKKQRSKGSIKANAGKSRKAEK